MSGPTAKLNSSSTVSAKGEPGSGLGTSGRMTGVVFYEIRMFEVVPKGLGRGGTGTGTGTGTAAAAAAAATVIARYSAKHVDGAPE